MEALIFLALIGLAAIGLVVLFYVIGAGLLIGMIALPWILFAGGFIVFMCSHNWNQMYIGIGMIAAAILWIRAVDAQMEKAPSLKKH